MNTTYHPQTVEKNAQGFWQQQRSFTAKEDTQRQKFYCLSMFPYPSGQLHMGHVRNYTLGDVVARYQRMLGKNVLQPVGWDAFGLPAENAALKHQVAPAQWTQENIAHMRTQFKSLGFAYDWSREIATCDPEYYRWEQWLFIQLFNKGLVYKKSAMVNWDPVDQTVLANEQVVDGRGWRSGELVERREISQWFIKITAYADELLADLDKLVEWPEQVRTMQRNWIGKSQGVNLKFAVCGQAIQLEVYTTRVDTLYGVTYLAIAPDHPLALTVSKNNADIAAFLDDCRHTQVAEAEIATMEKKGIASGLYALNPIDNTQIPIWIANYVVMDYGSGAVMAVPAHDQRDQEFAEKYQLASKTVVCPESGLLINSADFNGLDSSTACEQMTQKLMALNKGTAATQYRLRDWGVSRQRYWGTPIPIIYCQDCGAQPVPEDQLPVTLPENVTLSGQGSPLQTNEHFVNTQCPNCQADAQRETDTFDTFVESSWYFLRYACPDQQQTMLDTRANYWAPVDQYIGGIEHAVMHLLYARFFHKLLRDQGLVNSDEPFTKLLTQGMVLKDGKKMSKSKGNVVDPMDLIQQYGADTVRLFVIFAAPPEQSLEWSDSGVEGAYRFLKRVWNLAQKVINQQSVTQETDTQPAHEIRAQLHQLLKQADYDFERGQYNTVVSAGMKMLNALQPCADQQVLSEGISILLRILAPITPHICHDLWQKLGHTEAIIDAAWPSADVSVLNLEKVEFVVQVNGKLRAHIKAAADADKDSLLEQAMRDTTVARFIEAKKLRKAIVLPERKLINLVVS